MEKNEGNPKLNLGVKINFLSEITKLGIWFFFFFGRWYIRECFCLIYYQMGIENDETDDFL